MSRYCQVPDYCGIYYIPRTALDVYVHEPLWLPQVSLFTDSKLCDTSSRTTLSQTFVNPSKTTAIEKAKYNFPLYESCAVVSFRCYVGEQLIQGIIKAKDEAKAEYNEAVTRGETAGLLEQFTPDVFRTSLGNIPAGATVSVEVEYIMELKHDAEVDGLRFTIPTSIAPRYGEAPPGIDTFFDGQPIPGALAKRGMKISVQITMPSNVRSVQSPSHPISVHLGGHVESVSDEAFNPKLALATLGQTSTELGADFVLLVNCVDLSSPRALLETHPTIPNSKALMVTLVPKFTLPPGPKPEIVFVVDRSGSMGNRMSPLKSSLLVFLKSLPIGVKFNICSFGSSYSFLWKKSQTYSADSLEQAQKHVEQMDADMGGTEILPPIQATVSKRYKDLPLEIMVLTDGEVWNAEPLFKFIEQATVKGDVRVFSLGIGQDVSHSLVEGMARVGRGFAQIVAHENEGIEGKVVRMLRGGLGAHIQDYRLEWDSKPTEERSPENLFQTSPKGKSTSLWRAFDGVKKKISLFDKQADLDSPISPSQSGTDRFAHLPEFNVPVVLQAPYKIPPLFPFSRTTVYVLLTGDVKSPSSVWLRGTTPSGDELELEIPVQVLPENAHTIHQLAARKLLQELEEGTGYFHSGNFGIDKNKNPGSFEDWVEREGIRVGVQYGLASKWTSFVAVQKGQMCASEKEKTASEDAPTLEPETPGKPADFIDVNEEECRLLVLGGTKTLAEESVQRDCEIMQTWAPLGTLDAPCPRPSMVAGFWGGAPPVILAAPPPVVDFDPGNYLGGPSKPAWRAFVNSPKKKFAYKRTSALGGAPSTLTAVVDTLVKPDSAPVICSVESRDVSASAPPTPPLPSPVVLATPVVDFDPGMSCQGGPLARTSPTPSPPPSSSSSFRSFGIVTPVLTAHDRTKALIGLQSFEGSFSLTSQLAEILNVSLAEIQAKLVEITAGQEKEKLWATVLAVCMFEGKLTAEKAMWELVVEKARDWISTVRNKDVASLEGLAKELLGT